MSFPWVGTRAGLFQTFHLASWSGVSEINSWISSSTPGDLSFITLVRNGLKPRVVARGYNPSIWETDAG